MLFVHNPELCQLCYLAFPIFNMMQIGIDMTLPYQYQFVYYH